MDRNVVSLELAKKLKEAGWPQEAIAYWFDSRSIGGTSRELRMANRLDSITKVGRKVLYAAPTAQELADALPKYLKDDGHECRLELVVPGFRKMKHPNWIAAYANDRSTHLPALGSADTMADALALLWLEIQS